MIKKAISNLAMDLNVENMKSHKIVEDQTDKFHDHTKKFTDFSLIRSNINIGRGYKFAVLSRTSLG